MSNAAKFSNHRVREWRRRVFLPARVRSGASWSDGRVLNISSRGMLVQLGRAVEPGQWIEIRQGAHSLSAEVMWSRGCRAGVRSDGPVPVDAWLVSSDSAPPSREHVGVERRKQPRGHDRSRIIGRYFEFAAVGTIGVILAAAMVAASVSVLLAPLAKANEVLAH